MYVKIENSTCTAWGLDVDSIKFIHPNTSFPLDWAGGVIDSCEYLIPREIPIPIHDSATQVVIEAKAVLIDGVWTRQWEVKEIPEDARIMIKRDATMSNVNIRNNLLEKSDWTQLPDAPLSPTQKQEFVVYRQALRDITEQDRFPFNVTWPVNPLEVTQNAGIGVSNVTE